MRISVLLDAWGPRMLVKVSPFGPVGGVTTVTLAESSHHIPAISPSPALQSGKFTGQVVASTWAVVVTSAASMVGGAARVAVANAAAPISRSQTASFWSTGF